MQTTALPIYIFAFPRHIQHHLAALSTLQQLNWTRRMNRICWSRMCRLQLGRLNRSSVVHIAPLVRVNRLLMESTEQRSVLLKSICVRCRCASRVTTCSTMRKLWPAGHQTIRTSTPGAVFWLTCKQRVCAVMFSLLA